jgi:hypothetical protein
LKIRWPDVSDSDTNQLLETRKGLDGTLVR